MIFYILLFLLFFGCVEEKVEKIEKIEKKFEEPKIIVIEKENEEYTNQEITGEIKRMKREKCILSIPHLANTSNNATPIKRTFSFYYKNKTYSFDLYIPAYLYENAKNGKKETLYFSPCENVDWFHYFGFFNESKEDRIIESIAKVFEKISNIENYTIDEKAEMAVAFVQDIPYDEKKTYKETMRFPVEVLVEKKGVCSEKSILLARLLAKLNFSVALIEFPEANHMMVGIKCKEGFAYSGYCAIETTQPALIGEILPIDHKRLENMNFTLYVMNNGTNIYSKEKRNKEILKCMKNLEREIEVLAALLKNMPSVIESEEEYEYWNSLVKKYNHLATIYNNQTALKRNPDFCLSLFKDERIC